MQVTALYAGLLAPLFVLLSIRVIGQRRVAKVAIGHGDDSALLRRMRVHANFAEYVPLALVLMALLESMGANAYLLHALGATLLIGRLIHAFGVSQDKENLTLRVTGMAMTFTVLITASLACLAMAALGAASFAP
ncbi:MAG: MAPEG family protein [Hyphomicrobiaceae bacterium]